MRDITNPSRITTHVRLPIDQAGNALSDPLSAYKVSDQPTAAEMGNDVKHYGYLAADGSWCIMQTIDSTGTFRFAAGAGNYSTAWSSRASIGYDYFSIIF